MKFIKYLIVWISQQLAMPFWIVGHVHLSMNMSIYDDVKILFASLGMHLIVAVGFWFDWLEYKKAKIDHIKNLTQMINNNTKKVNDATVKTSRIVDEISKMKIYK